MKYESIIDNEIIDILTYNYETILAEKLQTIISLGVSSSRSKDLFDIYIITKLKETEINYMELKKAIEITFTERETNYDQRYLRESIIKISVNKVQKSIWERYSKNNYFVKGLSYEDVTTSIYKLIDKIS